MDRRRNWILVDSLSGNNNQHDRNSLYATPALTLPSTSRGSILSRKREKERARESDRQQEAESRIHSINVLNDRIQKRVAAQQHYPIYANSSSVQAERYRERREEERLVDESFRFITDEEQRDRSAEARLDRLIQHRNSQGEIDAVYEKRYTTPQQPRRAPPTREWISPTINTIDQTIYPINRLDRTYSRAAMNPPYEPSIERQSPVKGRQFRKRSDSLDSGSLRLRRERIPSQRWHVQAGSADNLNDRQAGPSFLRRNSHFYNSCDVCAFKTLRPGEFCPFCAKGNFPDSPTRTRPAVYPPPQPPPSVRMHAPAANRHLRRIEQQKAASRHPTTNTFREYRRRMPYPVHPMEPFYPGVRILSAKSLKHSAPYMNWNAPINGDIPFRGPPSRHGSRHHLEQQPKNYGPYDWRHRPAPWELENAWREQTTMREPRRVRSPVFRYGPHQLPEELYDYDVYAKARDKRKRLKKYLLCGIAVFALAIVIVAGAVIAATS